METWRGVVNGIFEGVGPGAALDDATAARIARALVREPLGYLAVEDEYAALEDAIRPGTGLAEVVPVPHGEAAAREFLTAVRNEMDAQRPWPEPVLRRLHPVGWRDFPGTPVARVGMSYAYLGMLIGEVFRSPDEQEARQVLVLRLASGAELAFVAPWWRGSDDVAVLLRGSGHAPRDAVAELVRATDLRPADVTSLG
ncbi:hypothetical protein [Saccharopolyspora sp. NPDC002376]